MDKIDSRLEFRTPYFLMNPVGEIEFVDFTYWNAIDGRPKMMVAWGKDDQCTGLHDKNNNLIYENDLVKDQFGAIYQVIWQDDFASFYLMLQSGHPEFIASIFENESLEIIGNIHNKEQKQ